MQSLEEQIQSAKESAASHLSGASSPLRKLIYECTRDTFKGTRSIDDFVNYFKTLITDEDHTFKNHGIDIKLLLLNSVKMQDITINTIETNKALKLEGEEKDKFDARRANLVSMIQTLLAEDIITQVDCKIHFSDLCLERIKVVPSASIWGKIVIQKNTANRYKQNKFNLAREHACGYSSLINDVIMKSIDVKPGKPLSLDNIPRFLELIRSRIGVFYIDPNRVLGVLLDVFVKEVVVNYAFWLEVFNQWNLKLASEEEIQKAGDGQSTDDYKSTLAQLLGFKFQFYHRLTFQPAPVELYYACALLISKELVDVESILPYLSPSHDQMMQSMDDYTKNEAKSTGGGQLAMFGALGEEGKTERISPSKDESSLEAASDDDTPKYTANDIFELTRALLSIGEIRYADAILSRYNKACDMFPILSRHIFHIASTILEPAYENLVPEADKALDRLFLERTQESILKAQLHKDEKDTPALKQVIVTDILLDGKEGYEKKERYDGKGDYQRKERYEFFYKSWRENLTAWECSTVEHLSQRFLPLMRRAGFRSHLCPELIHKLVLIVRSVIERETEFIECRKHCVYMLREVLLPAISYSNGNPGMMASVWEIMTHLSIQERGALYYEWGNRFYKKTDETKLLKTKIERSAKNIAQRSAKDDRECTRDFGKLIHSNPLLVFNIMLDEFQKSQKDNQAQLMAMNCRYLGDFAHDVLSYVLAEKWTGSLGPGRSKKSKLKENGEVQAWLVSLAVFTSQLYKSQGVDTTPLLRYLAVRFRSDESVPDLTLLKECITRVGEVTFIVQPDDNQVTAAGCSDEIKKKILKPKLKEGEKRTTKRVLGRLKEALQKDQVALELLIELAWLYIRCATKELVKTHELYRVNDTVHQAFFQYNELLLILMTKQEYSEMIPDAQTLHSEYDLPVHIVMHVTRPRTQIQLREAAEEEDVQKAKEILGTLAEQAKEIVKDPSTWEAITPEFFATFWQLELYDIYDPPPTFYENNLQNELIEDAKGKTMGEKDANTRKMLQEEQLKRTKHVEQTKRMLKESQSQWFSSKINHKALVQCILQTCILPRSKLSAVDAEYCHEFVMMMHSMSVESFSSLTFFDKMISETLPNALMTYTEFEMTNYGRFIFKTFDKLSRWLKDEEVYRKEAHGDGLIGFDPKGAKRPKYPMPTSDLLTFKDFKKVMQIWHSKISKAVVYALQYGNALQIRNPITLLRDLLPRFPLIKEHAESLKEALTERRDKETRNNLKLYATSCLVLLDRRKKHWVSEDVFLGREEPAPPKQVATPTQPSTQPSTPKEEDITPKRKRPDESPLSPKKLRSEDESRSRREPSNSRRPVDTSSSRSSPRESRTIEPPSSRDSLRESRAAEPVSSRESSKDHRTSPDTRRGESSKDVEHSSRRETTRKETPPSAHHESPRVRESNDSRSGSRIRKRPGEEDYERDRIEKRHKDERLRDERVSERRDRDRDRHRDRDRDSHRTRRR